MSENFDLPNDDNGDVLRRMLANGDNLSKARNIDFTVVFPNELNAHAFGEYFQNLGYPVKKENTSCIPDWPWDVVVVRNMVPTHAAITLFEETLQNIASRLGGRIDGWGCFDQP